MRTDDELRWQTLSSEYLIREPWMTARRDTVRLPNGVVNDHYWVLEYPEFISVIPITSDGLFVIERQYRHGLDVVEWEIPAGVVEKGEEPLVAAKRELKEETGYAGGEWQEWMTVSPNPSAVNNLSHVFLARGVEKVSGQHLDRAEDLDYTLMAEDELFRLLATDQLKQSVMAAPLWKYFYMRQAGKL